MNLFLVAVFSVIVYLASKALADALDLLETNQVAPAACLGGCFMPLLGALPDAMLVLVTTNSQAQVSTGMGILVGSNVVLLTFPWFMGLFNGRRNLRNLSAKKRRLVAQYRDENVADALEVFWEEASPGRCCRAKVAAAICTRRFWSETGVTVYTEVSGQARLMMGTMIPFIVVQCVAFVGTEEQTQLACLVTSGLCLVMVFALIALQCVDQGKRSTEYKRYRGHRRAYRKQLMWLQYGAFYGRADAREIDSVMDKVGGGGGGVLGPSKCILSERETRGAEERHTESHIESHTE